MVRKRLITVLTFLDGVLFRTRNFEPDYRYTQNFVDTWSIDEIILLDITPRLQGYNRQKFYNVINSFAEKCFVPLCAGGGIESLDDINSFLLSGADKVSINTAAINNPALITQAIKTFGSQCIVASMDCIKRNQSYEVMTNHGKTSTGLNPVDWAKQIEALGAGELLLQSVNLDGTLQGYDNKLISAVVNSVNIPVLACSGAGNWQHFVDGLKIGSAHAVCTTNIYHFTDISIRSAKSYMTKSGIDVRNVE